jgi:hypothetical protein
MPTQFTLPCQVRVVAILLLVASLARGQQPAATPPSPVRAAAFAATSPGTTGHAVRFGRRAARVGDEVQQTLTLEMRLKTLLRQGNELKEQKHTRVCTRQRRVVTATEVRQECASAVIVRYLAATKSTSETAGDAADDGAGAPQPVAGKTYRCRREPGEEGKLVVTDEAGNIPSLDEYEIVVRGMDTVGRPNPLAEFLAGRTMSPGQTITLPNELAARLFSLGEAFGEIAKFELTLQEVRSVSDAPCAVFRAKIAAASNGPSQMRMEIEGPFVVEIATCRAADVELTGPISMTETRGTYSTAYHMLATGRLAMSVAAEYRDAAQ